LKNITSPETIALKPYNKCFLCPAFRVLCDGPRTGSMELMRWKEFLRDTCYIFHITIAYISEDTGLSKRTVENTLSENNDTQPLRETARLIENSILGTPGKYPCYKDYSETHESYKKDLDAALSRLADMQIQMQELQRNQDKIHEAYQEEMDAIRESYQNEREKLRAAHMRELEMCRCDMEILLAVYKQENEKKDKVISKLLDM